MSSLSCLEHRACDAETSSKAAIYCLQCDSLQCNACEKEIHRNAEQRKHLRLNLDEIDGEVCGINQRHPAIFYCPMCEKSFCYLCWVSEHQVNSKRNHVPQKFTAEHFHTPDKNENEQSTVEKPLYPDLSTKPSAPPLEDVQPHNYNKHNSLKSHHRQGTSDTDSNGVILLLNDVEQFNVSHEYDFIRQLKATSNDPSVKCVSIIGNTGDGKSYTLNRVFFHGEETFGTSSKPESCTLGVWAALDESQKTLVLDTEGRFGVTSNDNMRNRLLLKVMCISDIVIYRTRAPKLTNDIFQFLSDASNAFLKYFQKELENVMKNSKTDRPMSTMGPTLIVFHETQHTEVLRDHFKSERTAVEQLKSRFEAMNLSYDAYSSIEYVGVQTLGGKRTDFSELQATITAILDNNNTRSPRRLSVVFKSLKALNEKFNHAIAPDTPSTLPDEFFTCCVRCLSCGAKCTMTANHEKEDVPHQYKPLCIYNKELDNEMMKCIKCDREGRDIIVYGKLIAANDSLVQGIVKYVWSGFVIECPKHGEIYRSRQYWYGNNEPKDVTRLEVVHVWPGDNSTRVGSDVTPRKLIEALRSAGSYLSAPTKAITEMVADQIAPAYWVPNRDTHDCYACKLQFGSEFSKHHCRACGYIFCDTCTPHRAIVPLLASGIPERVCVECHTKIQSKTLTFQNNNSFTQQLQVNEYGAPTANTPAEQGSHDPTAYNIPMTRRILEMVQNNVTPVVYNYPLALIKESTRPNYWRPDNECLACFICKQTFNNTTHRLHHCRKCGEGVCDTCSPHRHPVPERDWPTPERICNLCEQQ